MLAFASGDDIARWEAQGRHDILYVKNNEYAVWAGDHYISSKTGLPLIHCPFLIWEGSMHACAIYETRPGVCADYRPASSQICPMYKK
jgi:Fe-S-cluster containining protein